MGKDGKKQPLPPTPDVVDLLPEDVLPSDFELRRDFNAITISEGDTRPSLKPLLTML